MTESATTVLLAGRYRVVDTLGRGEVATTYLVEDETQPGTRRVLKRFSVREVLGSRRTTVTSLAEPDAFKLVELFQREAAILSELRHPRVPRLVEFITRDEEDDVELLLVQEFLPGRNLADLARAGRRFTEAEVVAMGAELARILGDLHALRPPLVHRDVKPSNILRRESDGTLFLIDFGAVKHRVGTGGLDEATVVGTLGYMPLEQFEGRAMPASDVHALAATLVALMIGSAPHELPRAGLRPDFRKLVPVSKGLGFVLDAALSPDPDDRYVDGTALAAELERLGRGEAPLGPRAKAQQTAALATAPAAAHRRWPPRLLLLAAIGVGIGLALLGGKAARIIETAEHRATTMPDRGPVPFASPAKPLPPGQAPAAAPGTAGAPFFEQLDAKGLITAMYAAAEGDVWAAVDRASGTVVRFKNGDPARPRVVPPAAAPKALRRAEGIPAEMREVLSRELPGVEVTAIARGPGDRLWVGTRGNGLHHRDGGLWYRMTVAEGLPSDDVGALLIDRRGRLWAGSSLILLHADEAEASRRIKTVPRMGLRPGTVFETAVWAAEKLVPERIRSAGITWRRTDDRTYVFFEGRLVHPVPLPSQMPSFAGFARSDGMTAVLRQDGSGMLWYGDGTYVSVPRAPDGLHGSLGARGAFIDNRQRLWAWGTWRLAWFDGKAWSEVKALSGLPVSGIVMDGRGRIWVGTDRGQDGTLHMLDGESWRHLRCKVPWTRGSLGVSSLARLRDGRLLVGLSSTHLSPVFEPATQTGDAVDCNVTMQTGAWAHGQLTQDERGRLWMTSYGEGLSVRDGETVRRWGARDGILSDRLRAHAFDGEGRLWLLAADGRVGVYRPETLLGESAATRKP